MKGERGRKEGEQKIEGKSRNWQKTDYERKKGETRKEREQSN